jgi:hypothetical protein
VLLCVDLSKKHTFFCVPNRKRKIIFITLFHFISSIMPQLTPQQKHDILRLYLSSDHKYNKKSLSEQYNIKGGRMTISRWLQQWDGTPESLERREGSGRHTILTSDEVNDYIRTPIRNKNRSFKPIHYPQLHSTILQKTEKQVSLRTVQRYGKEQLGVKQIRTKKRTAQERKQTQ